MLQKNSLTLEGLVPNEKYKVVITQEALSDMERIYDYIAKDLRAPGSAMSHYESFMEME